MKSLWVGLCAAVAVTGAASAQPQAPTAIATGQSLAGELGAGDRQAADKSLYDVFVFNGRAGQRVSITLSSTAFDAYLRLLSGETELKADDDSGGDSNARINFTLPTTGEYVIWANGVGPGDIGAYLIRLEQTAAQAVIEAPVNPIRMGQTVNGRLADGDAKDDDESYYDLYRFRGEAGERVIVRLGSEDFDTYVAVHPAGVNRELATNDDRAEDNTDSEVNFTLPRSGDYDIWANSLSRDKTGAYRLSLVRAPSAPGDRATALRFDRPTRGRLREGDPKAGDDSYYDLYRFKGRAGERISVTMKSEDFDSYLSLHRRGEIREMATNDDGPDPPDSVLTFTLPEAGEYDIWANSRGGGERGAYTLFMSRGGPGTAASVGGGALAWRIRWSTDRPRGRLGP
jgi:hypothetical protein